MFKRARNLEFEEAARLRDEIERLKQTRTWHCLERCESGRASECTGPPELTHPGMIAAKPRMNSPGQASGTTRMVLLTVVVVVAVLRLAQELFIPLALADPAHLPAGAARGAAAALGSQPAARGDRLAGDRALRSSVGCRRSWSSISSRTSTHQLPQYQRQLREHLAHLSGVSARRHRREPGGGRAADEGDRARAPGHRPAAPMCRRCRSCSRARAWLRDRCKDVVGPLVQPARQRRSP